MTFDSPDLVHLTDPEFGPISLSVHQDGDGPAVLMSHGFPDLGYSWRHQAPALRDAGFRAIAPDQRGYGGSSAPDAIEAYGMKQLTGDLVGLLDALDIDKAVVVGHDWGGFVAWGTAVLHTDRCAGVVGICTPYTPFPGTAFLKRLVDGDVERQYMLWFQEPGVAEAVLDPRARQVFEKLMRSGVDPVELMDRVFVDGKLHMNPFIDLDGMDPIGEPVADAETIDHYTSVFERTGFRGGINWYRNVDANSAAFPQVGTAPIDIPALMICSEWDPVLSPALAAGMPSLCSDLEMHTIAKTGHWVQHEAPDAVNAVLVDWLQRRFGPDA